jgi:alkanesulfonate monooxygenase SsuD/methylene tetrahydromethanopterin reductase-like flavin-dependent oxidoreductase (luciferase family)
VKLKFPTGIEVVNPSGNPILCEMVATVQHAERLGYAKAWTTGHHFIRFFSVSASIFSLLAYLASVTSTLLPMGCVRVVEKCFNE